MELAQVESVVAELQDAFVQIQQPRSNYAIEHFVVGQHDTDPMRYFQTVLELQIKCNNIKRAHLARRKLEIEIKRLEESGDEIEALTADEKRLDIEDIDLARIGAENEFVCLYSLWRSFPHKYSRDEIQAAMPEYWNQRLERQAAQEVLATGRVGVGNQDAMRQIGRPYNGEADEMRALLAGYAARGGGAALRSGGEHGSDV